MESIDQDGRRVESGQQWGAAGYPGWRIVGMNTCGATDLENVGYALSMGEILARFERLKGGFSVFVPTPTPSFPEARYDDGSFSPS